MKALIRGAAGTIAMVALAACSSDATLDGMGTPTRVQANPSSMFVRVGDSSVVLARLVNDRNQAIPTEFTLSSVASIMSVTYDARYRPDYTQGDTLIAPTVKTQQRYFVKGGALGSGTFTLSSSGLEKVVTVVTTPRDLGQALSKTTNIVAGDTLTVTAPAGLFFGPDAKVTFTTGNGTVVSRAADSSSIRFTVPAGASGPATVSLVGMRYAPTVPPAAYATTTPIAVPAALREAAGPAASGTAP